MVTAIDKIAEYIRENPKTKLVFSRIPIQELEYIDMGYALSCFLSDQGVDSSNVLQNIDRIIQSHQHPRIGKYLAIQNISILFEPELRINLRMLVESLSRTQTLILTSPASVSNHTFHFSSEEEEPSFSLEGINYLVTE